MTTQRRCECCRVWYRVRANGEDQPERCPQCDYRFDPPLPVPPLSGAQVHLLLHFIGPFDEVRGIRLWPQALPVAGQLLTRGFLREQDGWYQLTPAGEEAVRATDPGEVRAVRAAHYWIKRCEELYTALHMLYHTVHAVDLLQAPRASAYGIQAEVEQVHRRVRQALYPSQYSRERRQYRHRERGRRGTQGTS